jgi:hypothetical protein
MNLRMFLAVCAAVLVLPTTAFAAGTTVTVRIEGKARTLLPATQVRTHSGSITRGGAPTGACPSTSAQGALDVATHHHWSGKWFASFQEYEIFNILGDIESGTRSFWEIFVNNVAATAGACEIALHRGEQLLFAVAPATGPVVFPLSVIAPHTATVGHSFTVKVLGYDAKGKAHPLAGAEVGGRRTSGEGTVQIDPTQPGTLTLRATKRGFIRDAVTVRVV